ncbi:MAG: SPOR domain-containing protein [Burkholderiales bacterium]
MAKAAISQEEIQLRKRARRRLVGASFMVLVMIVILPWILDSEPRPQAQSVRVQMPAQVREVPAPPAPEPSAAAAETPVAETPPDLTPPDAETQEEDVAMAEQAPETATEQTSLVIQLGAFSNPENARQLQDALLAEGIKAFSEVVKTGHSTKTRVRAGPFNSLAEAERMQARIAKMKLKLGMEPKIAALGQ